MENLIILNSAIMQSDGIYCKTSISLEEVKRMLKKHWHNISSYIRCPNLERVFQAEFGTIIPTNREKIRFSKEVICLCIQLIYRVLSPEEKRLNLHGTRIGDYVFSRVHFYPSKEFVIFDLKAI